MDNLPTLEELLELLIQLWTWIRDTVLSNDTLGQVAILFFLFGVAILVARAIHGLILKLADQYHPLVKIIPYTRPLYRPLIAVIMISVAGYAAGSQGWPNYLFDIATSMLMAWIVIRLASNFIRNRSSARTVALIAWSVAALDIINFLDPLIEGLKAASIQLGDSEITAWGVIWGLISFGSLIWLALFGSKLLEVRLQSASAINPSARVLLIKTVKIVFVSFAFMLALNSTGLDLTALAVFGGALGVGLGFGLQKVVSNFISGVILLLDRSVKPGDVIEIEGTYGSINALAARFTSIITRDGTEYLIPNEDMITKPVINWSHSNTNVRRRIPVMVDYRTDLKQAIEIMNKAASEHPRVLAVPAPRTLLKEFAESGLLLELRLWISDPQNGVSNIASEVMTKIWEQFHDHDIEFPFPQRVIHIKNSDALPKALGD